MAVYTASLAELRKIDIELAGGKAANLGELIAAGFPVPPGFVLTTAAYDEFVQVSGLGADVFALASLAADAEPSAYQRAENEIRALFTGHELPAALTAEITAAYQRLGQETAVAVRSSATAEDLAQASFAGQQDTYLNVRGVQALHDAVKICWASLWTARAMAYRARQGIDPASVRLAVVVQAMVEADAAGVLFTANPANGRRDQLVISAAWGLGESVVSGAVSTDDFVLNIANGQILSRRIADKTVMTGYAEHGTEELAVPVERRKRPVLDDREAAELAGIGARIAAHYGSPQDIEWVHAHGQFLIVQSRPITALPEPTGDTPTNWPVPYPKGMYFRASIVEQLPDPLTPLFADLIDGSVTRSLSALMTHVFGAGMVHDGDIRMPTVNGYAYYYYRSTGLWRMLCLSPVAMVKLLKGDAQLGVAGWRHHSHPRYAQAVGAWEVKPVAELSGTEVLDGVSELLDAGTVYYTAMQSIVPLAAISEIAFRAYYERLVRRAGDPPAVAFLLGYDSEPIRAEKSLYNLAVWTRRHPELAAALTDAAPDALLNAVRAGVAPAGINGELWRAWLTRLRDHLQRHGHVVFNLDFASPVPADDPAPVLETLRFYLRGQGNDPHQRQADSAARREEHTRAVLGRLDPVRRAGFTRLLRWAQALAPVREDALADIGLAWPVIRRLLLELGHRLTEAGIITSAADVFWLRRAELLPAAKGSTRTPFTDAVQQRKLLWRGQRTATAPQLLPEIDWIQRMLAWAMPAGDQKQTGATITGIGASSGQVTAPARVLAGPEQFGQMQPGDVLVARMTTPAWTSLFAMASGVVTDVGGPLSHSSIVAREYGIPAVLGTGVATQRLSSGQLITVDGDAGTVTRYRRRSA
ncbi:MAG TPA: PEP/pyruvate-binding domain-containing protein [Pseudonocardiaceae bacterium]|nr:PEP/pyruvate-binding domain-containing protein [Pseudonocardiaceae bacterium]